MSRPEPLEALPVLIDAFTRLGVAYSIGGSIASITHGFIRATADVDVVADLSMEHVEPLVSALQDTYYIDADMIYEAILRRSSFNIIFLESMTKVDVFLLKTREYDQLAFGRTVRRTVPEDDREYNLSSAEDVVLFKLEWYRIGDCISDRQWWDVTGVLKVQGTTLDLVYMRKWATVLGVLDLLEKALLDCDLA